jgi:hypothetical protein
MAQTNSTDGVNDVIKTKRQILKKLELEQRRQIKYQSTIDEWCKVSQGI